MPFTIGKQFRFEAAHHLPNHAGKCRSPHGHSYLLEVVATCDNLVERGPMTGMVYDFGKLSEIVRHCVIDKLDHTDLNESAPLLWAEITTPTAEVPSEVLDEISCENRGGGVLTTV